MSETYHRAAQIGDLSEGAGHAVQINGVPVFLCVSQGEPRALLNRCTHMGTPLTGGRIKRGAIVCPDHGAIFDLTSGKCAGGFGYIPLTVLPSRIVDGWLEVALPARR